MLYIGECICLMLRLYCYRYKRFLLVVRPDCFVFSAVLWAIYGNKICFNQKQSAIWATRLTSSYFAPYLSPAGSGLQISSGDSAWTFHLHQLAACQFSLGLISTRNTVRKRTVKERRPDAVKEKTRELTREKESIESEAVKGRRGHYSRGLLFLYAARNKQLAISLSGLEFSVHGSELLKRTIYSLNSQSNFRPRRPIEAG